MGAFSSRGGKYPILFFAREFIENKAGWFYPKATELNLTKIVLEEIGHYIDFRLNKGIDSKGDEGELFAYLTLGHTLSESDYHLIKNRDDFDKISLNGDLFEIEDATIYFKAAFEQPANDDKKTGNQVYGSLKFVSNPDNSTFTNSLSGSNQIFGTLYYINSSGVSTSVYGSFTSRYPTGNSVIEALSFQSSPTGTNLLVCLPNATVANYGPNKTGLNNSANFTSSNNIGTLLDQYIGTARTISIYQGGETQQTTVGTSVSTNPSIKVTDQNNNPVSGVLVNFSIISGNGSVSQATVTTDALGIASTVWTLGTIAGSNSLQASSTGLIGSPLTFNATGIAGALDHFAISSISSPQTAGTAITGVTLTAQDVYNNTVTSFTGTVTYSGTAGITGTSGTFTAGQLTGVSITPTSAGSSKTFIVTGGSPSKTGTATFDVNAGGTPPSGLAYPSSTQTTYGTSGTISQSSVSGTPTINYSISSSAPAGTISITSSGTVEYYSTTPAGSYSITITASNNYGTTSTTISLVVNKKPLTVSGITVTTKTYNGTTSATLNTSAATLVTPASGDAVTLDVSGYTATFDTKNIGSAKPVTVTGLSLSGTDAGNYTLTQPSGLTGEITSKGLTITANDQSKTYGQANPALTITYAGFITGEDENTLTTKPTASTTATTTSNVGTYTITGSGGVSNNYTFNYVSGTLTITAKSITGTFSATDKVYDGTTSATVSARSLSGVLDADANDVTMTGGTATFANAEIGNAKTVTLTGASLSGTKANNYSLTSVATTTANILSGATASYLLNQPTDVIAGDRAPYTVTRKDAYNNLAVAGNETVYISANNTGAKFFDAATGGNEITSVQIAAGQSSANFWFRDTISNTYTITASDKSTPDGNTDVDDATDEIIVKAATAIGMKLSGPSTGISNVAVENITATVVDQYGNNAALANPTTRFQLTTSATNATFDSSVVRLLQGTTSYTFKYTSPLAALNTINMKWLVGNTDSVNAAKTIGTHDVTISAGPAAKLVIRTQPIGDSSGKLLKTQPVIEIQDAQGNLTSSNATIAVAIKSGANGSIGGTTSITAVNG
ncbi:MAG: beta strand repeat-containing protein, partial [Chitinophagaceae bacterium]